MSGPAPLRFLALVLGGWTAARAVVLVPAWLETAGVPPPALVDRAEASPKVRIAAAAKVAGAHPSATVPPPSPNERLSTSVEPDAGPVPTQTRELLFAAARTEAPVPPNYAAAQAPSVMAPSTGPMPLLASSSRWRISAWVFMRRGDGRQLATGGSLGGSQAGARLTYRLRNALSLSGRVYAPLHRPEGAEAAVGVEWQPLGSVPVRLLAERRQAIGSDGRSAFAILAHGGVSDHPLIGRVTVDAYAQAGVVGLRTRDAFADGGVRLGMPLVQDLSIGVGAWGAAQPGASRLDAGPQVSYRLPVLGENIRISAEWRMRIAGDARPGSGPALTLSTDF